MQLLKNLSSNTATGKDLPAMADSLDEAVKNTEYIKEKVSIIANKLDENNSQIDNEANTKDTIKFEFVVDFKCDNVVFDFLYEEEIGEKVWSDYLHLACVDFDNSLKNKFLIWDNSRSTTDYEIEIVIKDNRMTKLLNESAPIENKLANDEELSLSEILMYENYSTIKNIFLHNVEIKSRAISLFLADDNMRADLDLGTTNEVLDFIRQILNYYGGLAQLQSDKYRAFDIFLAPSPKKCKAHFIVRFLDTDIDFDCTFLKFGPELIAATTPSCKTKRIIAINYYILLAFEIIEGRNIYADKHVLDLFGAWQIGYH